MEPHPRIDVPIKCVSPDSNEDEQKTYAFFPSGYSNPAVIPIIAQSEQGLERLVKPEAKVGDMTDF